MAVIKSPVFLICCGLFILHQIFQKLLNIHIPVIDDYLDSLLAMPVILTFVLLEKQWLFKKGITYQLPVLDIILVTFYLAIVTEVIFPKLSEHFKADWIDVALYIVGSMIFHLTINKRVMENYNNSRKVFKS